MPRDLKTKEARPGGSRFFHWLAWGLGAAALASTVLTFLEMKAAPPTPGEGPNQDGVPRSNTTE